MKATHLLTGVFFGVVAITGAGSVRGAVFTVDLAPTVEVGPDGEYLSAAFDLGVELASIQSVLLEFVMPTGYEGSFVVAGNSISSQTLQFKLHDTGTLPDGLLGPNHGMSTNFPRVNANELSQVLFYNLVLYTVIGDADVAPPGLRWPKFLYEGEGQVSLYVLDNSWSRSLPTGEMYSATTEWSLPPDVEDLRLIITGTVVPEPSSVLFATLGLVLGVLQRKR